MARVLLERIGAGTKTGLSVLIVPPPKRISNRAREDSGGWRAFQADSDRPSSPIFAESQFAFFALIFLRGQAGFSTVEIQNARWNDNQASTAWAGSAQGTRRYPVNPQ